ncbi:ALCAM [Mytilus coruscus]|uniref:ALCAM n=1 Tax=Mytilus coruscus TaxID=42192 RepID=A0A6J8A203_MYTCO|nr:ALCAM [Mytilus coruscus]
MPADSPMTTTKHMNYSSSSLAITSRKHGTVTALQSVTTNKTTAFNYFILPKAAYDTTSSIPSNDISYRTTTYSTQQTTTAQRIVEGDNITVVCRGYVGKPPATHDFKKYLNGKMVPKQGTVTTTSTSEMPENCSYYRTSNFTFQVTAQDNKAVIRCVVNSSNGRAGYVCRNGTNRRATTNKTTAFNYFILTKTAYDTTSSIPSNDISYRTTTYSTQQTTTAQRIVEGDNITVVCRGYVGKPPATHDFKKYLNGKMVPKQCTVTTTSTSEMPENCSYYRTSNFTFQVTAQDNKAVIRCVVNSSMEEPDMYVETEPIEVYCK